jgi:hypothetical protein
MTCILLASPFCIMKTAGLLGIELCDFIHVGYRIQYSVGLWAGQLRNEGGGGLFPAGTRGFSLIHRNQTGSGACSASYLMGTVGSFTKGKVAPPPPSAEVKNSGVISPLPHTFSWCGS